MFHRFCTGLIVLTLAGNLMAQQPPSPQNPAVQQQDSQRGRNGDGGRAGGRGRGQPSRELSTEERSQWDARQATLQDKLNKIRSGNDRRSQSLLPDAEIFHRAVGCFFKDNTSYPAASLATADRLLNLGNDRADQLLSGRADWLTQTGLVVRGFRSTIDDTVQPYGLVIGEKVHLPLAIPVRCDIWFHGRNDGVYELQFINQRLDQRGEYELPEGIVLHPFGRFSNAFRFAGETDTFEALDHVKSQYRIDDNRIAVRGFSMGGAGAWGFAVHHPTRWFAANPGAGFSETMNFLGYNRRPDGLPPQIEQTLWNLYDAHVVAENLVNVPTIAYSGEIDGQKQAADVMEAAAAKVGLSLTHIIGPQTPHRLHPDSKRIMAAKLDELAVQGRNRAPENISFSTFTLKYNQAAWLTLNTLEEHWKKATVEASIQRTGSESTGMLISTRNVNDLAIRFAAGESPFAVRTLVRVEIDGSVIEGLRPGTDRSFEQRLRKADGKWSSVPLTDPPALGKRHDLQGPVDDAFMSRFLFVRPTGDFTSPALKSWTEKELERAIAHWRIHLRGDARVKNDVDVRDEDMHDSHLVLWGCPRSNSLIARVVSQLPLSWTPEELKIGETAVAAAGHVPVLIYPNPLNPQRYVVLNSGFTWREFAYQNNARQTPKLPDWAILDLSVAPNDRYAGKIVAEDFFDERWQVKPGAPMGP